VHLAAGHKCTLSGADWMSHAIRARYPALADDDEPELPEPRRVWPDLAAGAEVHGVDVRLARAVR
jgi:hypothetical protein